MKIKEVTILQYCDGWEIVPCGEVGDNNKEYRWDHNDEDLGTKAIAEFLKDQGFKVTIEESY